MLELGSVYQGGCWDHDGEVSTPSVMAVFRSTDGGENWMRDALSEEGGSVYAIHVHPTESDIVYAGGHGGSTSGLFKSTDGGWNWDGIESGINGIVYSICTDPSDPGMVYVGTQRGVYVSSDGGTTWIPPTRALWSKCIVFTPEGLFTGTTTGVYASGDQGATWDPMNAGLLDDDVECMDYDADHGILYVGTDGSGVFRYSLATSVEEEYDEIRVPVDFVLYQNSPNPFNAGTEIRYELIRDGMVRLSVFDITGKTVRNLVSGYQTAGLKKIIWDGKDSRGVAGPSGVYIYRLETQNRSKTKKMVMQK